MCYVAWVEWMLLFESSGYCDLAQSAGHDLARLRSASWLVRPTSGSVRPTSGPARPRPGVGPAGVGTVFRTHAASGYRPVQNESVESGTGRGPCRVGKAIVRSLRRVRSGKGRGAIQVLRGPCLGVPGFRLCGHEADKREIRKRRKRRYEHRGGCGT